MTATAGAVAHADETPLPNGTTRLAGADRYETSAAVSRRSFAAPVTAAFVATGTDYADALAGGPAAARRGGPVLLVRKDGVPKSVQTELARLRPTTIYVLGGTSAISSATAQKLGSYATSVVRLSGSDRYATATAVSRRGWSSASTVFLASGAGFADALSGGAAAAHEGVPLLLTQPSRLTGTTRTELARLKPSRVYVLGGTGAVSDAALSGVRSALPGASVTRLSGADRYATSAKIARTVWSDGAPAMFFATGLSFADALSGTPAAKVNDAPLVLTKQACLPSAGYSVRSTFAPGKTVILGGTGVLSNNGATQECGTMRYSGTGDDVITISKPGGATNPAIATLTHDGSEYFSVWGLDSKMEDTDLLVSTVGPYRGTVLFDDYSESKSLQIQADGAWTVAIRATSAAPKISGKSASGHGDTVLNWSGSASTARLTHDGSSNFIVEAYGRSGDWDLLVNEIGSYQGTVRWPAGPRVISIEADGNWSIAIK
ncbi:cell wall-binding repeat-containing protein [Intrasporangium sp.]|uniref:cell wall-binding repeat-containing protein n=1 Tax=Intrasporangium sp. TaxID=1925024 RepID=UPI003221AA3F